MKCPRCGREEETLRTKKQQALFHGYCSAYSRASGQGAAYVKLLFKYHHGIWVPYYVDERGKAHFPEGLPSWPGRPVTMFKGTTSEQKTYMKSEAAYTVRQENRLIEGAGAECFDIGADLSWMGGE